MVNKYYVQLREAAWSVLSGSEIHSYPVMMSEICKALNLYVVACVPENGNNNHGAVFSKEKATYIFVDRTLSCDMQRIIIAHEVGHFILSHLDEELILHVGFDKVGKDSPLEKEAEAFAMRITMPMCVMRWCEVQSADETASLFGVPYEYAKNRYKRYREVKKRDKFLLSENEQYVFRDSKNFINEYREQKSLPPIDTEKIIAAYVKKHGK